MFQAARYSTGKFTHSSSVLFRTLVEPILNKILQGKVKIAPFFPASAVVIVESKFFLLPLYLTMDMSSRK